MLGHGGSSAGSYLADPTSPIPSHCAVIILFQSVPVHQLSRLVLQELMQQNYAGCLQHYSFAMSTLTFPEITCRHTGHWGQSPSLSEQSLHVAKCLHARNKTSALFVRDTLHVMQRVSSSFSSIRCLTETEDLNTIQSWYMTAIQWDLAGLHGDVDFPNCRVDPCKIIWIDQSVHTILSFTLWSCTVKVNDSMLLDTYNY